MYTSLVLMLGVFNYFVFVLMDFLDNQELIFKILRNTYSMQFDAANSHKECYANFIWGLDMWNQFR